MLSSLAFASTEKKTFTYLKTHTRNIFEVKTVSQTMGELEEFSHKGVLLRVLALANEGVCLVVLQKKKKKRSIKRLYDCVGEGWGWGLKAL